MPKLEQGDLEGVDRLKRINIPHLAKLVGRVRVNQLGAQLHPDV